jgi:hypothetical protein
MHKSIHILHQLQDKKKKKKKKIHSITKYDQNQEK